MNINITTLSTILGLTWIACVRSCGLSLPPGFGYPPPSPPPPSLWDYPQAPPPQFDMLPPSYPQPMYPPPAPVAYPPPSLPAYPPPPPACPPPPPACPPPSPACLPPMSLLSSLCPPPPQTIAITPTLGLLAKAKAKLCGKCCGGFLPPPPPPPPVNPLAMKLAQLKMLSGGCF